VTGIDFKFVWFGAVEVIITEGGVTSLMSLPPLVLPPPQAIIELIKVAVNNISKIFVAPDCEFIRLPH